MAFIEEELILRIKDKNTLRKSFHGFYCASCNKDFKKGEFYIGGAYKWQVKRCVDCYNKSIDSEKDDTYKMVDELMKHIKEQSEKAMVN